MEDKLTKKARGFDQIIGSRISLVDAGALNEVMMVDEEGYRFLITVEEGPYNIPVITCTKMDESTPVGIKQYIRAKM